MRLGSTFSVALLVTLTRPATWLVALAAFLLRGGIVWFLVPILTLPTPVGLANALGPSIVGFVFGGVTLGLVLLSSAGVLVVLLWLIGGGAVAGALESSLVREVAGDEEVAGAVPASVGETDDRVGRVLAVRLLTILPLLVALIYATARAVSATYAELTVPRSDGALGWRVLQDVPDAVVLVAVLWVLGEVLGGLAVRAVVLEDRTVGAALGSAARMAIRHPLRTAASYLGPTAALLLVLIPSAAAASVAWDGVRATLADPHAGALPFVALLVFLGLWAGGLLLTGAVCAWRHAVWTVGSVTPGRGTFGGSPTSRPGDWNEAPSSGTF